WRRKKEPAKATADLEQALKLKPHAPGPYNTRGLLKLDKEDFDGAFADFDQAITVAEAYQPGDKYSNAAFYYNRGLARLSKQDNENALNDFNKALLLRPRMATAYNNHGLTLMRRGKEGDLERALADFNAALTINPGLAPAYFNRGLIRLVQNDDVAAEQDFKKCLELDATMKPQLDQAIRAVKEARSKP
ncbi:MAG TPA: tetratricopeptide repeat protein, partial [Pyrinomonadaceae bacterium]|nr:tetratricopeptide repeat protein [Pyrinomonadaceae bacterium]